MGISEGDFCARYPLLWHMAEDATWPSIQAHGLRSTSSLLDLYGIEGDERARLETEHRSEAVELRAPRLPVAVIRDQAPIHEPTLATVLRDGLTPSDWYRILNERVFFWVSEKRLDGLLAARLYRDRAHTVVVADTQSVLDQHRDDVTLTPMNTGNTRMIAMPRGLDTFASLAEYPFEERRRAGKEPVVELAVMGMISEVERLAVRVERRAPGGASSLIWEHP